MVDINVGIAVVDVVLVDINVGIAVVNIVLVDIKVGIAVVDIIVNFFVGIIIFWSWDCSSQD